jgi:hypothetical protein
LPSKHGFSVMFRILAAGPLFVTFALRIEDELTASKDESGADNEDRSAPPSLVGDRGSPQPHKHAHFLQRSCVLRRTMTTSQRHLFYAALFGAVNTRDV